MNLNYKLYVNCDLFVILIDDCRSGSGDYSDCCCGDGNDNDVVVVVMYVNLCVRGVIIIYYGLYLL